MTLPVPPTPTEIMICSLVRDGMDYLPAYRAQLEALKTSPDLTWKLCILEGDSKDGSEAFLRRWAEEDPTRVRIGKEDVGNTAQIQDRAERWARVANACFDLIPQDSRHTHVLWLEADLCFPPELLRRLVAHGVDIVAPIIFLGGHFYDTWGFRDPQGRRWRNQAPYHPDYRAHDLLPMSSVGSCVLFRREILDAGIRMRGPYESGLLVGMCLDAAARGFRTWADTGTAILHPMDPWEAQMWECRSVALRDREGKALELPEAELAVFKRKLRLSVLDASLIRRQGRALWRHLYPILRTNRIRVRAEAWNVPPKGYRLSVEALPPSAVGTIPWVRRALRWVAIPRRPNALADHLFACDLDIRLVEPTP